MDYQNKMNLKLQPKLSSKIINPSQFEKMRVHLAANVFSFETQAELHYLIDKSPNQRIMKITAKFVGFIAKWFAVISYRESEHSLNENNENFNKNIKFLNDFIKLMENITYNTDNIWRPIQSDFIFTSKSSIELQNYLFVNISTKELIARRLTTDSIENLFSQIRS